MSRTRTAPLLLAVAIAAAGCQAVLDAGDAAVQTDAVDLRDDLVADGFSATDADCLLASLAEQGVDVDAELEAAGGRFEGFIEAVGTAWPTAMQRCVDEETMQDLVGDMELEELRDGFVSGFVATSGATREQADCVFEALVDRGVTAGELAGQLAPETFALLPDIFAACGVEQADLSSMTDDEIRTVFIDGFAATDLGDRQDAACVFDGMVAAGIAPLDFAGEQLTAEAEVVLGDVLQDCGVGG